MQSIDFEDVTVVVLAEGDTPGARAHNRGHLFERFFALLLEAHGYEAATAERVDVTSDGVEIDIRAKHRMSGAIALAECKAYSTPVAAKELMAFVGKLVAERDETPDPVDGFFVCLPKLTQPAVEKARQRESRDKQFHYVDAQDIARLLTDSKRFAPPPAALADRVLSDLAIVVTKEGLFGSAKVLDAKSRVPTEVAVWSASGVVADPALEALRASDYGDGLACVAYDTAGAREAKSRVEVVDDVMVEVRSGNSDFEYQLPVSPKFFVGRKDAVQDLTTALEAGPGVVVINAQSGWGKSSLSLQFKRTVEQLGGVAIVLDCRTASRPSFVAQALRLAALRATRAGSIKLTADASWASTASALTTLERSEWAKGSRILLIFDQFENVFRDEALTREFRDLAFALGDSDVPVLVGFAWKTDVVGWTEGYPFQLRDAIRDRGKVTNLGPLGPTEIGTILRRLEKAIGSALLPELKSKLREYSQGLPWLVKKLSSHVLAETSRGVSQADLAAEALNIQRLFEADLANLQPQELEALRWIAKYAPVAIGEATEKYPATLVQSLLDQRLIVQVAERLDTYWDIFRDYLNTDRVPIEDAYILRQLPLWVGRMLQQLVDRGGAMTVEELAKALSMSENVVQNVVRDARLLGLVTASQGEVSLVDADTDEDLLEEVLRGRVQRALRRHRAFTQFQELSERFEGEVDVAALAAMLPKTYPAVAARHETWLTYARAFARWMEYAGFVTVGRQAITWTEADASEISLLQASSRRRVGVFPQRAPDPSLRLLSQVADSGVISARKDRAVASTSRDLLALGLVSMDAQMDLTLALPEIFRDGSIDTSVLLQQMKQVPGAASAIKALEDDPKASPDLLGGILRAAQNTSWAPGTTALAGKQFRAWANRAGIDTGKGARRPRRRA
ncbi:MULTISPECIES: restriction endonuclease [Microbacterium]|uniref:nSTAND1 domain-containing NTPase n=1 Tax=Microbacterium TaxID=33882 RepID=UPI00146C095A|nr:MULTISPECIES: restriction endonuclease [Microbacterium]